MTCKRASLHFEASRIQIEQEFYSEFNNLAWMQTPLLASFAFCILTVERLQSKREQTLDFGLVSEVFSLDFGMRTGKEYSSKLGTKTAREEKIFLFAYAPSVGRPPQTFYR